MSKAKRKARIKELASLMAEATANIKLWDAEFDRLVSDDKPERTPRKSGASAKAKPKAKPKAAPTGSNGSGRGEVTAALRAALKSMSGEFTTRELIVAAGILDAQVPSAAAAISRMKPEEIKSGTAPGKYRRA
jgi:hypothetical protein